MRLRAALPTLAAVILLGFTGGNLPAESPVLGGVERPRLIVDLAVEIEVSGRFIRLKDVVTVAEDFDEVWGLVGQTWIRVRDGGFVRRVDVERRLARAGLPAARFEVTGPAFCLCHRTNRTRSNHPGDAR